MHKAVSCFSLVFADIRGCVEPPNITYMEDRAVCILDPMHIGTHRGCALHNTVLCFSGIWRTIWLGSAHAHI